MGSRGYRGSGLWGLGGYESSGERGLGGTGSRGYGVSGVRWLNLLLLCGTNCLGDRGSRFPQSSTVALRIT